MICDTSDKASLNSLTQGAHVYQKHTQTFDMSTPVYGNPNMNSLTNQLSDFKSLFILIVLLFIKEETGALKLPI